MERKEEACLDLLLLKSIEPISLFTQMMVENEPFLRYTILIASFSYVFYYKGQDTCHTIHFDANKD